MHISHWLKLSLPNVFHNESSASVSAILPSSCHAPLSRALSFPETKQLIAKYTYCANTFCSWFKYEIPLDYGL